MRSQDFIKYKNLLIMHFLCWFINLSFSHDSFIFIFLWNKGLVKVNGQTYFLSLLFLRRVNLRPLTKVLFWLLSTHVHLYTRNTLQKLEGVTHDFFYFYPLHMSNMTPVRFMRSNFLNYSLEESNWTSCNSNPFLVESILTWIIWDV